MHPAEQKLKHYSLSFAVCSRMVKRSTVRSPISSFSMRPWRMPSFPIANAPTATAPTAIAPTAAAPTATASSANPVDAEMIACFGFFIIAKLYAGKGFAAGLCAVAESSDDSLHPI